MSKTVKPAGSVLSFSRDVWEFIPGVAGFQASRDGRIRNRFRRVMRQRPHWTGAMQVDLAGKTWMVHNLILSAWTGSPSSGYYPKHLNGNKSDNRLENLVWAGKPRSMKNRTT